MVFAFMNGFSYRLFERAAARGAWADPMVTDLAES
jgi:hypothetical protein